MDPTPGSTCVIREWCENYVFILEENDMSILQIKRPTTGTIITVLISLLRPIHGRSKSLFELVDLSLPMEAPKVAYRNDSLWVVDGHHRIAGASLRGRTTIAVEVVDFQDSWIKCLDLETINWSWDKFLTTHTWWVGEDDFDSISFRYHYASGELEALCRFCADPTLLAGGNYWEANHQGKDDYPYEMCGSRREVQLYHPILGEKCSCCGGDPGNGFGGYSHCCGAVVEDLTRAQTQIAMARAWFEGTPR